MAHDPQNEAAAGDIVSVSEALEDAARALTAHRGPARLEAEVLLAHVLGCRRVSLHAHPQKPLEVTALRRFRELYSRRAGGEPLAYLTGSREFWSLDLEVGPAVLIPRPETEILVEAALEHLPAGAGSRVADLGTGCGAIALALARERPSARILASDSSREALAVARRNVARTGAANVTLVNSRWLEGIGRGRFEVIVSNPPYVAEGDPHLGRGDLRFEPRAALAAGPDGLVAIREIVSAARHALARRGVLLLEHGFEQARAVRGILADCGYRPVFGARDYAGHERVSGGFHSP